MIKTLLNIFTGDSRNEIEKYIQDELNFNDLEFIRFVILERFNKNPAEKNWFFRQEKFRQKGYVFLLYECENQSAQESVKQAGNFHPMSPQFKIIRDENMKRYGLHLWGEEFIRFHEPDIN